MNAKTTVGAVTVLVLVILGLGATGSGSASLLSIKYPDKNPDVPAGSLIAVSGTSAPSNATHTNCEVEVQINQHGYTRASPQGPKGVTDYTKWTAISASRIQQGLNQIEAQLLCFPLGIASAPNLVKHLVHNVTGVRVVGLPTTVQSPSKSTTPAAPTLKKTPTGQGPHSIIPLMPPQ
ncbi:MAG TPA: hypothetical protein VFI73_03815 [Candidatus Nitrosopolaris sp.]|nr:hypothetical protein [Candidatus Nitrosopolaris sp.]